MAFPFIFESNFEAGTFGEWDSETDVEGVLNIKSYAQLAREDVTKIGPIAPYRGAFLAEWNLTGDTADHILIEGDIDIADTATADARFYLFLGKDLRGVTDVFNIFELQGTANAVEAAVGLRITTGSELVEIGVGQTAPATFSTTHLLEKGRWYCIELETNAETNGTGTSTLYVDGASAHSIAAITNTAVLRGVLGVQNTLSTTLGHIFVDQFVFDDTRVYPLTDRFSTTVLLTKSGHVFVGSGEICNGSLLAGAGTDCSLLLYDTDKANTNDASNIRTRVTNTATGDTVDLADVPIEFRRGCYAVLSGTTPRAILTVGWAQGFGSVGRVRQLGSKV